MPKRRLAGAALAAAGCCAVLFYLVQHMRLGPNHVDGGLLLGYIQTIAEGGRPYFDFLDVYGLASWPLPTLFYVLAGKQVWGLRLWLVLVKVVALVLSYALVRRLSDRLHAILSLVLLTLLLGLPWQLLQTTYAFLPAFSLELAVAFLLLGRPHAAPPPGLGRLGLAGVLIGVTLCVKLNSGAMIWAGAMFAAFYMPLGTEPGRRALFPPTDSDRRAARFGGLVRAVQLAGLLAYAGLFHLFIWPHYHGLYAVYLSLPLGLLLLWTASHLPGPGLPHGQLRAWAVLLLVPPLSALLLLGLYLGPALPDYLHDTAALLAHLSYVSPVPPVGQPGQYIGFNESYWPQFHWLVTLVFGLWWWRVGRSDSRVPPFFALFVCNLFVMYSRTDESHLHQAMLLGVPLLWVAWAEIGAVARAGRPVVLALAFGFTAFACVTLGAWPTWEALDGRSDWSSPRLAGIHYHHHPDPHVRPFAPGIDMRTWDRTVDLAALHLRQVVGEGAEVLVLGRNELLTYASHTTPAGGRFRYLFYLVKNHHFEREDFFAVAPNALSDLLERPPAAIVASYGDERIVRLFPEIRALLDRSYVLSKKIGHLSIFVTKLPVALDSGPSKPPI